MTETIHMTHEDIQTLSLQGKAELRMIAEGEAFVPSQSIDVGTGRVEAVFAFRAAEGSPRYEKRVVFDFSGVSQEKLLDLALYEVKQKVQGMLRKAGDQMLLESTYRVVDVQTEIVAKERAPAGPQLSKVAKELGLTTAQAAKILLQYSAHQSGGMVNAPPDAPKARKGGKK